MTKAEEFDKARRLAYKGDFSLVEKLYHPDCKHFDHRVGLEVNLDMQSALMTAYENTTFGPFRVIYENEEFLCIQRYVRNESTKGNLVWSLVSGINYIDGKIIRHETSAEELDYAFLTSAAPVYPVRSMTDPSLFVKSIVTLKSDP